MTPEQLQEFENVLLGRKEQIISNIKSSSKELDDLQSVELNDEGDYMAASVDNMINEAITLQQRAELDEIVYALGKIHKGNYGVCEMCEDDIDIERLRVKPHAKYCIICRPLVEQQMQKQKLSHHAH